MSPQITMHDVESIEICDADFREPHGDCPAYAFREVRIIRRDGAAMTLHLFGDFDRGVGVTYTPQDD